MTLRDIAAFSAHHKSVAPAHPPEVSMQPLPSAPPVPGPVAAIQPTSIAEKQPISDQITESTQVSTKEIKSESQPAVPAP